MPSYYLSVEGKAMYRLIGYNGSSDNPRYYRGKDQFESQAAARAHFRGSIGTFSYPFDHLWVVESTSVESGYLILHLQSREYTLRLKNIIFPTGVMRWVTRLLYRSPRAKLDKIRKIKESCQTLCVVASAVLKR